MTDSVTRRPDLVIGTGIGPVRVIGDALELGRALRNLADNAARHARSQVDLRVWADERWAYLEVTDDGPGVPAGDRQRIFQRFVRLDDSRSRADGGSGLGLPITREIVSAHGGSVYVLPAPEAAAGMRLRIRLPLAEPPAPTG